MNTASQSKTPTEAALAHGDLYRDAITREGLVPSDELLALVTRYHRATLTAGLILRAFHALRQSRSKHANQGTPAASPARS
jgi:hypothetical protein